MDLSSQVMIRVFTMVWWLTKVLFESKVKIIFQNIFHLKIHQNNFFYFLKLIFNINISKKFNNTYKIYCDTKKF
jgi:hypothetical protein